MSLAMALGPSRVKRRSRIACASALLLPCGFAFLLGACEAAVEPASVELELTRDASGIERVTTDLGYVVTLDDARLVATDFTFFMAGELHAGGFWRGVTEALVPTAHAHPGHYQGGDVAGELLGHFVVDFTDEDAEALGSARFLVGTYSSAAFTFGRAGADDVGSDDALRGHTAVFRGVATRSGVEVTFLVQVDAPEDRVLEGIPFEHEVTESTEGELRFRLRVVEPIEGKTLFDGIDFELLAEENAEDQAAEEVGLVRLGPESALPASIDAYNLVRRALLTHDHYDVRAR